MNKLAQRLELVMGWRALSRRAWAAKAQLSPNGLNAFFQRAKDDDKAGLKSETLFALARAANISAEWLFTGKGDPEPALTGLADLRDAKTMIGALGQAFGLSRAALDEYHAHDRADASPLYWMGLLVAVAQTHKAPKALPRAKTS